MSRHDLALITHGHSLVVIGVGIVIGIRLIERSICRPAAEHVGIGMIERESAGLLNRGLREYRRRDRRCEKRGGNGWDELRHGEYPFDRLDLIHVGAANAKVRWVHAPVTAM